MIVDEEDLWVRKDLDNTIFKLNRNSQKIISMTEAIPQVLRNQFFELLIEIESSVPIKVEQIFNNEPIINEEVTELSTEARKEIRLHLLRLIKGKSFSVTMAKDKIISSGIFSGYESEIENVASEIKGQI